MRAGERRRLVWVMVALGVVTTTGCNRRLLSLFFDVPPRPPTPRQEAQSAAQIAELKRILEGDPDTIRPAIERTLDPDSALKVLPRDHAGNVDWVTALKTGVIKPRGAIPGSPNPDKPGTFTFAFDFLFPGPDTTFDASFPHSTHTAWLNCAQCHPRIFKYRGAQIKMADVFQGKFCGECHGKVSFPVLTACERCHTKLQMPANRAQPELLGTIQMRRAQATRADSTLEGNAAGVRTEDFPTARFPHWLHRVRYTCKACHMGVFEPKAGANRIVMKDITEGRACGKCHNGATAFPATFGYCERCHAPTAQVRATAATGVE